MESQQDQDIHIRYNPKVKGFDKHDTHQIELYRTAREQDILDNKKCIECYTELHAGVGYFMFECSSHAICRDCLRQCLEVLDNSYCHMCATIESYGEHNVKPQCEDKNSLPVICISETTAVKVSSTILRYKYTTHIKTEAISNLSEEYNAFELQHGISWRCGLLNTEYEDVIIACGELTPTLTVLTTSGVRAVHTLSEGRSIKCGCYIRDKLYLICVGYNEVGQIRYKLMCVCLDVLCTESTSVIPVVLPNTTSDNISEPIHLFSICKQRLGVLCTRQYKNVKGCSYNKNIIRIHSLDSLLTCLEKRQRDVQANVNWGRRYVRLSRSNGSLYNSICVTPRSHFCLAQYGDHTVHIYSKTGLFLLTIGRGGDIDTPLTAGVLYLPGTLISTGNSDIIVVGWDGDIHVFTQNSFPRFSQETNTEIDNDENDDVDPIDQYCLLDGTIWKKCSVPSDNTYGDWRIQRRKTFATYYSVLSESRFWSVCGINTIRVYKIE